MFVAGIADAVAALFGDGVGAIAMQDGEIKVVLLRQMSHAGDERLVKRAVVSPFREHLVDGRVVDQGGPIARRGYWHALPLHTRIEDPQNQIENAVIPQFAFRPAHGHREVLGWTAPRHRVPSIGLSTTKTGARPCPRLRALASIRPI